jgi:hypothetical protein
MDYYNMMYGRVRHAELIAEAQRENRIVAEDRAERVNLVARVVIAVRRIFTPRASEKQPTAAARRLATK